MNSFSERFAEHQKFEAFMTTALVKLFDHVASGEEEVLTCVDSMRLETVSAQGWYRSYWIVEEDGVEYFRFTWDTYDEAGWIYVPKDEVMAYLSEQWDLYQFDRKLKENL